MKRILFPFILIIITLSFAACGTRTFSGAENAIKHDEERVILPQEQAEEPTLLEEEPESPQEEPSEEYAEAISEEPEEAQTPEEEAEPEEKTAAYVRAKVTLNVRAGAGTGYAILGRLDPGDCVAVREKTGDWYKTWFQGKDAYVSAQKAYAEVFSIPATEEKIEAVIAQGCRLLGTEYVYGAARLHDGNGRLNAAFDVMPEDDSKKARRAGTTAGFPRLSTGQPKRTTGASGKSCGKSRSRRSRSSSAARKSTKKAT